MAATALSAEHLKSGESRSLIDELNGAVETAGDNHRERILERVADLFAAKIQAGAP